MGGQLNERHVHEQIQGPSPPAVLSTECLPASVHLPNAHHYFIKANPLDLEITVYQHNGYSEIASNGKG